MSDIEEGFTSSENVPGQAQSRASKLLLDDLLAARQAKPDANWQVADPEPVAWVGMYRDLLEERVEIKREGKPTRWAARWDWRKALYIAWSCVPTSKRWPKHEIQLIELLGLANTATIRKWKASDPEIEKRIAAGPKKLLGDHIADVLEALVKVASDASPQGHQDRKLFLELTEVYKPKGSIEIENPITIAMDADQFAAMQAKAKASAGALEQAAATAWDPGQQPDAD